MRRFAPVAWMAALVLGMLVHGPIHQPPGYHDFADRRAWLGVANASDVLSNAAFLAAALWAFARLFAVPRAQRSTAWRGFFVFAIAIALTAAGSAYYHLAPDDARLVWDRLPIALACAGLLAAVHAQTHARSPAALLPVLVVAAIASVEWWNATRLQAGGDLRPYLLFQAALVLVPLWQWIHGSPRAERIAFGAAIVLYAAAKACEAADQPIYAALGFVSGHTIKHLLSAAAALAIAGRFDPGPTPPR
ncbi:MAG TPA: hypothetical protein VLT89_16330 [Usitatibacter sp.]|nr:hypothetical protein [Usitatibacter sp.]